MTSRAAGQGSCRLSLECPRYTASDRTIGYATGTHTAPGAVTATWRTFVLTWRGTTISVTPLRSPARAVPDQANGTGIGCTAYLLLVTAVAVTVAVNWARAVPSLIDGGTSGNHEETCKYHRNSQDSRPCRPKRNLTRGVYTPTDCEQAANKKGREPANEPGVSSLADSLSRLCFRHTS